jgi:hypothetical protein
MKATNVQGHAQTIKFSAQITKTHFSSTSIPSSLAATIANLDGGLAGE